MSKSLRQSSFAALLFWFGATGGSALALGPVDGNELTPTDLERVQVGTPAPDFTLEDEKGTPFTLSQFRDKKNAVLVFYRGHW